VIPFIALDLTRLALSPLSATPRGLERVEYAYARHFLKEWPGDCAPVLMTPWGLRFFDRWRAVASLDYLDQVLWKESVPASEDPVFATVCNYLAGSGTIMSRRHSAFDVAAHFVGLFSCSGIVPGKSVARSLPAGSVFLSVGQLLLRWRPLVSWLSHRRDVKGIFMLHDAIPLDHPELVARKSGRRHGAMIKNAADFASGLIFPSNAAKGQVLAHLARTGRPELPSLAVPLPLPESFVDLPAPSVRSGPAYFVACGAFEPRKNYGMLLRIWQNLVGRLNQRAPLLVMVGEGFDRTRGGANIAAHDNQLQGKVIAVSGLATPGLKELLAGSRALLMPSLAEGFGLPIVEALALGRPVLASDLPAHREAGGQAATYIDRHDESAWEAAILSLFNNYTGTVTNFGGTAFEPSTSRQYFKKVEDFLASFA
jgi:glycosyltransferase involved in cell wall biosynthesis